MAQTAFFKAILKVLLSAETIEILLKKGLDGRCFPVAPSVSTPVLRACMTDRNQICPNGRASTVTDVLARPCKWQTPFSGRGDAFKRIVNKFRRPAILQLNIDDLTASKMSVLYHFAAQREALVILLQETHCASAQRSVLLDYQLAGFSLSRKHGIDTFVHKRLKWTLFDQSPPTSKTEWLCADIDGCKMVNVYKPPPIRLQVSDLPVIPVSMLATLIASMLAGVMMPTVQMGNAWLAGQIPTILSCSITQRMPPASNLAVGIQVPTRILHSSVSIQTIVYLTDKSKKFPRSQQRPSLITPPRFARPVPSKLVKRRNFRKTK